MAKVHIEFKTDNAAFADGQFGEECGQVLEQARNALARCAGLSLIRALRDYNGNTIGRVEVEE